MAQGKYKKWLEPGGLALLEGWARDGMTDEEIAKRMGINRATLYAWKEKYPDISDALKKGKEVVDYQVENALLRRALGYTYEEVVDEDGPEGKKRRVTVKHVAPDVTAQIFWLKNSRPDKWRDKPTTESTEAVDRLDGLLKEFRDAVK